MSQIEVTVEPIFLTSGEPSGRIRVRVSQDETVETLLRKLCKEANTPFKVEYCLQSKGNSTLHRTDVLSDVGVHDGAYLTWTSEVLDVRTWSCGCNIFWFMALISFFMGVAILITICVIEYKEKHSITDYAVIFDAGSSHTAMFIYKWEGSKLNGTALAVQSGGKCTSRDGAISNFASDPSAAGNSLKSCLHQAMSKIPEKRHSKTPIYLGATAGMRILRKKNPLASELILESIRSKFKSYPFSMKDPKRNVRIIDGDEEGTFSWITSNYVTNSFNVLKYLPSDSGKVRPLVIVPTIGAMDLGGASTQISYIPEKPSDVPKNFSRKTELFHHNYTMYTHSYACYGVNEVHGRLLATLIKEQMERDTIYHPCLPDSYNMTKTHDDIFGSPCVSGKMGLESFGSVIQPRTVDVANKNYTFQGESYPSKCSDLVTTALFNFTAPCPYSRCSFNGVYQPPVNGPFYAFSSFFYVMKFLNLTNSNDTISYDQFIYAIDSLCLLGWSEVQKLPGQERYLPLYCEEANYIHVLLTQGYGFTGNKWLDIHFVGKLFTTEIGWTLGFVLDASHAYPSHTPGETMYKLTFYLLMTLSILFIMVAVGFVIHALREKKGDSVKYHALGTYGAI